MLLRAFPSTITTVQSLSLSDLRLPSFPDGLYQGAALGSSALDCVDVVVPMASWPDLLPLVGKREYSSSQGGGQLWTVTTGRCQACGKRKAGLRSDVGLIYCNDKLWGWGV